MPGLDWGPFPQVAASLRLHPREVPLAWLDRLGQTGSPWQHVAREPANGFWPASLHGAAPAAVPALPWWMRLRARAPVTIDGQALTRLIPPCHAWLATENTRFLGPWLAPDPRACPLWIGNTSDRALVWSLIAFATYSHGPAVILAQPALMQKALLDEHAAPGDLLVLHRDVERLAAFWLEQTGRRVANLPSSTRAGGLRTETFPHAVSALPSVYKNAILSLASYSPLTRLAYLDLFAAAPRPRVFVSLASVLPTYAQDSAPWLALLADTLLGAVLGRPPDLVAWKRAETELRRLEAESVHWGFFQKRFSVRLWRQRSHTERLKARVHDSLLARLESWYAIARAGSTQALQVMVLDRLARMAAVRATPAMLDEWRRVRRADPMAYAAVELFQPQSAYYAELASLLLAVSLDELHQLLSTTEEARLSELLDGVLNVPAPTEVPDLLGRFWDDLAGVRLPFRPRNHRGPCPATIFSELLVALLRILSPPQGTADTAAPEETDDAYATG